MAEPIESLYKEFLEDKYQPTVDSIVRTINGEEGDRNYLQDELLTPKFAVSGNWESITSDNTYVMADFVSADSELPIKRRDSLGKVSGKLVKSGMSLALNETQMQDIDTMIAVGADEEDIVEAIMDDTTRCIRGHKELIECALLEELSTGVCEIDDEENVGIGVRINAGYLDENKFSPQVVWSDTENSKPLDDLEKVIDAANAKKRDLNYVWMDRTAWKQFRDSRQVREYIAGRDKKVYIGGSTIDSLPKSTLAEVNSILREDETYGVEIRIVSFKAVRERNGVRTTIEPWKRGMVVFTRSTNIGTLWHAKVAEDNHRVDGTTYVEVGNDVLLSKYRTNKPTLKEWTQIQARTVPVVNGAEGIYQIDTTETTTDSTEDSKITIGETEYKKSDLLTAIASVTGVTLPTNTTDAAVVQLFNSWSKKVQADVIAAVVVTN